MSDREKDPDQDVEELFGDLDEFFAPIEDVEWPSEGAEKDADEGERPDREEAAEDRGADEEWSPPEIEVPTEGELLQEEEVDKEGSAARGDEEIAAEPGPAGSEAEEGGEEEDVDVSDFFAPKPDEEEAGGAQLFGEAREGAEPAEEDEAPGPAAAGTEDAVPETTAEMTGEEWAHLRTELGEADEVRPEEAGEEELSEGEEEGEDEVAEGPVWDEEGEEEEELDDEDQELADEPVLAEEATFESEEPEAPAGEAEPEEPQDVEAAAAHFASGLDADEVERDLLSDLGAEEAAPEEEEVSPSAVEVDAEEHAEPLAAPGGPTWQEPASRDMEEVAAEEAMPPPPTGRNLPAAVASGAILGAAAIALLAIGKGPFVVLAIGLVLLGQGELYAVLKQRGFQPATGLGLIAGLFIMVGAYIKGDSFQGEAAMLVGLALGMVLSVLWYMAASPEVRAGTVRNVAVTLMGLLYVPFLASFALLLLAIPGDSGRNLLLTVVGLTVLYDVSAFAIGTLWGNRPLAPTVSPRKSWEGAIGATFVLLVVALALVPSIDPPEFTAARAVGLALVIAIAAPLGDLVESAIKRDLGVKDMGSILPGHGGILDRFDAILFAAPAAYYYVRLIF